MKYGYFDDLNKEYVITEPKTPYPWINYLGTEKFFSLVSNTAGGYCFYKDARLRRITRYRYNDIPVDNNGRYFYINDSGDIWSPTWKPVKADLDFYECRHGLGYTHITGKRNNLKAEQLMFVPIGSDCEIHKITLTNESDSEKTFKLFSYVEFCLWNAYDDMTNFQRNLNTGEVEVDNGVIYHKTEYRERRDHYSFYSVNTNISGFDTDRDSFLGIYNGVNEPECVKTGESKNSVASGWHPIASHLVDVSLKVGETKSFVYVLGYVENAESEKWEKPGVINKAKAKTMIEKFNTCEKTEKAFDELKTYWSELLNCYTVSTGDEKLDRMVNIWNQYQCMVTFNMSRSASYFESGIGRGMGFRDSNQDLMGFVHLVPERARERILDIAATQFEDVGCYHQYQPLTKKGNNEIGGGFNDDPMWLICGVASYIKETGDFDILNEQVPYDCNPNNTGTLFEHLKNSFYHVVNNLGPHGLPLIGRADWNDCLNLNCFSEKPDESFQTYGTSEGKVAESVFIAGLFVYAGKDFAIICQKQGLNEEAKEAQKHIDNMIKATLEFGCDPEWFLRAYDANGEKIGSNECIEGKIFIEPQGMCVMAGIGKENGFASKALESVEKFLDTKYGIVLQQPPYSKYYINLGEISSYPPGYKENAGIFCHNNPWIAIAETELGHGNRAFEVYKRIAPAYLEDISEIHKTEPYVYSQAVGGCDAQNFGQAKNSWLTGTASWNFFAISQSILGIKPQYDGLMIDPCLPESLKEIKITRIYRGTKFNILIDNTLGVQKGIKSVFLDGEITDSNLINKFDGKTHSIVVTMG